jgi:glycosyltransferase involved in cell wall biosynthesis
VQLPPYYFTGSSYLSSRAGVWFYLKCERLLNSLCTDQLIYASSRVMEEASALGLIRAERTTFIGNGVDLTRYCNNGDRRAPRAECGVGPEEKLLCCVSRLDQQKGIEVLLEAFSRLELKTLKARLWLVGDGPLHAPLKELAQRYGIQDYVQFLGFRRDVDRLLPAADIFVLASHYEAMPLSILEAMASGLPCVVSDKGENALLVKDMVNGLLVPIDDAQALARALERLLAAPELCRRMGEASRRAAEQYSDAETARRVRQIYHRLARKP